MKIATIGLQLDINKGAFMYYSASRNGFFDETIHDDIPDDVKKISDEYYIELFSSQGINKKIQADKNGYPVLVELRNNEDLVSFANGNKKRNLNWVTNELRLLDYSIELKIITSDERIRRNKLMKYFIELSKINVNDGKNIEWPEKPN